MRLNCVVKGMELIGTVIKKLNIENNIADISREGKHCFGLNINEPEFQMVDNTILAYMLIDFEIEVDQDEEQSCRLQLSLEGAFISEEGMDQNAFKNLVIVNGAAALIGIARGKIEAISANIFNSGKIVIPFVNVVDYYKSIINE